MHKYKFYTYDNRSGKDIVIVVEAFDQDTAWDIFRAKYHGYFVDTVSV